MEFSILTIYVCSSNVSVLIMTVVKLAVKAVLSVLDTILSMSHTLFIHPIPFAVTVPGLWLRELMFMEATK